MPNIENKSIRSKSMNFVECNRKLTEWQWDSDRSLWCDRYTWRISSFSDESGADERKFASSCGSVIPVSHGHFPVSWQGGESAANHHDAGVHGASFCSWVRGDSVRPIQFHRGPIVPMQSPPFNIELGRPRRTDRMSGFWRPALR